MKSSAPVSLEFCTCSCGCTIPLRSVSEIKAHRCRYCFKGTEDIDAKLPPMVDLDAPDPLAQALRLAA
jgi:hypothetical protein